MIPFKGELSLLLPLIALELEDEASFHLDLDADISAGLLRALGEGDENSFADVFAHLEGDGILDLRIAASNGNHPLEPVDAERFARALSVGWALLQPCLRGNWRAGAPGSY